jgi:hypothetical protein
MGGNEMKVGTKKHTKDDEIQELKDILEEVLDVVSPMVDDWKVCPSCNNSWHNHSKDCELNLIVKQVKEVLSR